MRSKRLSRKKNSRRRGYKIRRRMSRRRVSKSRKRGGQEGGGVNSRIRLQILKAIGSYLKRSLPAPNKDEIIDEIYKIYGSNPKPHQRRLIMKELHSLVASGVILHQRGDRYTLAGHARTWNVRALVQIVREQERVNGMRARETKAGDMEEEDTGPTLTGFLEYVSEYNSKGKKLSADCSTVKELLKAFLSKSGLDKNTEIFEKLMCEYTLKTSLEDAGAGDGPRAMNEEEGSGYH